MSSQRLAFLYKKSYQDNDLPGRGRILYSYCHIFGEYRILENYSPVRCKSLNHYSCETPSSNPGVWYSYEYVRNYN